MKNRILQKILIYINIVVLSLTMLFILTGCSEEDSTKGKVEAEVKVIENRLVSMLNELNHIKFTNYVLSQKNLSQNGEENTANNSNGEGTQKSGSESGQSSETKEDSNGEGKKQGETSSNSGSSGSSDSQASSIQYEMKEQGILGNEEEPNWSDTKNEVENLYSIWSSMIVDLHQINVNNDDILNFSNQLDDLIVEVQKEDKINTSRMIANLYSYIPKYVEHYTENSTDINLAYAKSNIVSSYALVEQDNWDEAKKNVEKAQEYFSNIINNANDKNIEKQNILSKTYVLLGEFSNSINKKDKQLYYIKYKSLMQNIENLE